MNGPFVLAWVLVIFAAVVFLPMLWGRWREAVADERRDRGVRSGFPSDVTNNLANPDRWEKP